MKAFLKLEQILTITTKVILLFLINETVRMKHLKGNATYHSHSYVLTNKMYLCTHMVVGTTYTNIVWPPHLLDAYLCKHLF